VAAWDLRSPVLLSPLAVSTSRQLVTAWLQQKAKEPDVLSSGTAAQAVDVASAMLPSMTLLATRSDSDICVADSSSTTQQDRIRAWADGGCETGRIVFARVWEDMGPLDVSPPATG
jgi:hypothetical protein